MTMAFVVRTLHGMRQILGVPLSDRVHRRQRRQVQDQFEVLGASLASASRANCSYEVAISSIVFLAMGSSSPSAVRRASSERRRQYAGSSIFGGVGMQCEHAPVLPSSSY